MDDENYTKIKDGALIPTAPLPWFDYNCKRKVLEKLKERNARQYSVISITSFSFSKEN